MDDNALIFILNYAFSINVGFTLTDELPPDSPSFSLPQSKRVFVNMNWQNKKELPFIAAHELGHVLNGDNTQKLLYYTTSATKIKIEYEANKTGIDLLLKFCESADLMYDNYLTFMDDFGVPKTLTTLVKKRLTEWLLQNMD